MPDRNRDKSSERGLASRIIEGDLTDEIGLTPRDRENMAASMEDREGKDPTGLMSPENKLEDEKGAPVPVGRGGQKATVGDGPAGTGKRPRQEANEASRPPSEPNKGVPRPRPPQA